MDLISIIRSSLFTFVGGVTRNLLAVGLSWLVSRKVLDASSSSQLLTFVPIAVGAVAWSLVEKYVLAKLNLEKVQVALSLPAGSSVAHLDEALRKQKEASQ